MRDGIVDLANGRSIAYTEWGSPYAPPVLYFHGSPGSRREMQLTSPVLERRGIRARVIGLNRPGYGPSTFVPGRTFLDWPADVAAIADRLGIDRFAVLGASGGCPYALACGLAMPDRVARIGIVAGVAPVEASGMADAYGIAGIPVSAAMRRFQSAVVAVGSRTPLWPLLERRAHRELGAVDRSAMQRADVNEWFRAEVYEAFSGLGRGAAYEAGLYLEPWGFDVAEVTAATSLWYCGEDRAVPPSAGRWLADRLPNCDYTVWPQHGHFTWAMADEAADVVATLAA